MYLAISDLLERLKDLLGCVLILCFVYHEPNELLKGNLLAATACFSELLVHFLVVVY